MRLAGKIATMARRGAPLPYDAEVEYLESTEHGEYIDTGVEINYSNYSQSEFEVMFKLLEATNKDTKLFGALQGVGLGTISNNWRTLLGINYTNTGTPNDNIKHIAGFKNGISVTIDGNAFIVGKQWGASSLSGSIFLFRIKNYNQGGVLQAYSPHREYYAVIKIDGKVMFDAKPVRFTNSLGVSEGAMYDSVSGQLFRNAGTGAFVVGPDKVDSAFSTEGGGC